MKKLKLLLLILASLWSVTAMAQFEVRNTSNYNSWEAPVPYSLRKALADAQASGAATKTITLNFAYLGPNPEFTFVGDEYLNGTSVGLFGNNITLDGTGGNATFKGSPYSGSQILAISGTGNRVIGITFTHTTTVGYSVRITGSGHAIQNCIFQNSSGTGLQINAAQNITVTGSTFSKNQINGIQLIGNCAGTVIGTTAAGTCSPANANVIIGNGYSADNARDDIGDGIAVGTDGGSATGTAANPIVINGNYIGVDKSFAMTDGGGASNGNSAHGISLFTASYVVIGKTSCPNFIGNNGFRRVASGIALYVNSNNITVEGNNIGTDGTNGLRLGNRFDGVTVNGSQNNIIRNNVICNNYEGIGFRHFGTQIPSNNLVENNLIGVDRFGRFIGNGTKGISVEFQSNTTTIQNNTIKATGNGFSFGNGAATPGTLEGVGIAFDQSGSAAVNNLVYGNTIGRQSADATAANNTGAAIYVRGNSVGNKIGDLTGTRGNTIGSNGTTSDIIIDGANANRNTILGNRFICATAYNTKGIQLLNNGNANYGNPNNVYVDLSSGSGTVTGGAPAGSVVHVYQRGVCDVCTNNSTSANYSKGLTYLGIATMTGSTWSYPTSLAPSSIVVTATDANGNTSEFSYCKTLCTTPSTSLVVTASPNTICFGSATTIRIANGEANVTYQIVKTGTTTPIVAGPTTNGNSVADVNFPILTANLPAGSNSFTVQARGAGGCTSFVNFAVPVTVQVDAKPNLALIITGVSPICQDQTGRVNIANAEANVTYQAYIGATAVGAPKSSATAVNPLALDIPVGSPGLSLGFNNISVRASNGACLATALTDTARIVVNKIPSAALTVTGVPNSICQNGSVTSSIRVTNAEANVTYQVYAWNGTTETIITGVSNSRPSVGNLDISIPAGSLPVGFNQFKVHATIPGGGSCANVTLSDTAGIRTNILATPKFVRLNSIVTCQTGAAVPQVIVESADANVVYNVYLNGNTGTPNFTGSTAVAGDLTINLTSGLVLGNNSIVVSVDVPVCGTTPMQNSPLTLTVNKVPSNSLSVVPVPNLICQSGTTTGIVRVVNAEANVTYQVYAWNGTTETIVTGASNSRPSVGNLDISIPAGSLPIGFNQFKVHATIPGGGDCSNVTLNDTTAIRANKGADPKEVRLVSNVTCQSGATVPQVIVENAEANVIYDVYLNGSVTPNFSGSTAVAGDLTIDLTSGLVLGANSVKVSVNVALCGETPMINSPLPLTVNKVPSNSLNVVAVPNAICQSGLITGTINIQNAEPGVVYQVYAWNGTTETILTGVSGSRTTTGTLPITIPAGALPVGFNQFKVHATIPGGGDCANVILLDTVGIKSSKPVVAKDVELDNEVTCQTGASVPVLKIVNADRDVVYRVFLNNSTVANFTVTAPADGDLTINLTSGLVVGKNPIKVTGTIAPCADETPMLKDLELTVNKVPSGNLIANGAPSAICQDGTVSATINVLNAEPGVTYQVYTWDGTTETIIAGAINTNNLATAVTLPITVPAVAVPLGFNQYKIHASIPGGGDCANVILTDTVGIRSNKGPNDGLVVLDDQTICSTTPSVSLTITGAEDGVKYEAFTSGISLGSIVGTTSTLPLDVTKLAIGANTVSISASIVGCEPKDLKETVVITKNQEINAGLKYDVVSPVCEGNGSSVTVNNPQAGVDYRVSVNGTVIGSATPTLTINTTSIPTSGNYIIEVEGFIAGCGSTEIDSDQTLTVRKSLDQNIGMTGSTVCAPLSQSSTDRATITINSAQPGVTYTVRNAQNIAVRVIKNEDAVAKDLVIELPVTTLAIGGNSFSAEASNDGACDPIKLSGGVNVYVIKDNFDIHYDTLVCKSAVQKAEVVVFAPGATRYNWVSRQGAVITDVSLIGDYIGERVTIDYSGIAATVTHDTLEVYAAASGADCNMYKRSFIVRLVDNVIVTTAPIDTVCRYVYGPDSITVNYSYYAKNAIKYQWSMTSAPAGSRFYYTSLDSSSIEVKFPPQPRSTNQVPFSFAVQPYSLCSNSYLSPEPKQGVVLATPDVNAGKDIDTIFALYQPILLDGAKTTEEKPYTTSLNPANQNIYQYYWRPLDNGATLSTPDKIQTYMKSDVLENSIELTVWNRNRCAVTDTVNVKVQLLVTIPNAFTPNGDGRNDVWEIKNIEYFPNNNVVIYNQWGSKVYEANPYHNNWEGTHNGEDLPIGTYYYIFDIKKEGFSPSAGSVTIVK